MERLCRRPACSTLPAPAGGTAAANTATAGQVVEPSHAPRRAATHRGASASPATGYTLLLPSGERGTVTAVGQCSTRPGKAAAWCRRRHNLAFAGAGCLVQARETQALPPAGCKQRSQELLRAASRAAAQRRPATAPRLHSPLGAAPLLVTPP